MVKIQDKLKEIGLEVICDPIKTTYIPSEEVLGEIENKIETLI